MVTVAIGWLIFYTPLVKSLKKEKDLEEKEVIKTASPLNKTDYRPPLFLLIIVLSFFSVANNFVKDGLTTWTPAILDNLYSTPDWLSIILTLLLPTMAIGGTVVAVNVQKKVKDFVFTSLILFSGAALLFGLVNILVRAETSILSLIITIVSFAVVSCLMAGVNNVTTGMVPLYESDRMNSGKLAGILNGFCYLGSTISSYGLGFIADKWDWNAVFITLLIVCAVIIAIGLSYVIPTFIHRKLQSKK